MRYSQAFDPAKMESVLRKQIEVESKEKIANLEKDYQQGLIDQEERHKKQQEVILNSAVESVAATVLAYVDPLFKVAIGLMVRMPPNERDSVIRELPDSFIKTHLVNASSLIEVEFQKAVARFTP